MPGQGGPKTLKKLMLELQECLKNVLKAGDGAGAESLGSQEDAQLVARIREVLLSLWGTHAGMGSQALGGGMQARCSAFVLLATDHWLGGLLSQRKASMASL